MKNWLPADGWKVCLCLLPLIFPVTVLDAVKKAGDKDSFAEKRVVAWINGEELTYEQYDNQVRLMEFHYNRLSARRVLRIKQDLFTHMVGCRLLIQEARQQGLRVSAAEMKARLSKNQLGYDEIGFKSVLLDNELDYNNYRSFIYEDILIEKLLARNLAGKSSLSEKSIDDYYFSHLSSFVRKDMVRARHIFFRPAERKKARIIRESLRYGDFGETVRRHSRAEQGEPDGDLGYFQRHEKPTVFFDSCWELPVGGISRVIKSAHGYHIFKVLDKIEARMLTVKEARAAVVAALERELREKAGQVFLRQLYRKADIRINEDVNFLSAL